MARKYRRHELGEIRELKRGGFFKLEKVFSIPNENPMNSAHGKTKKKWVRYY